MTKNCNLYHRNALKNAPKSAKHVKLFGNEKIFKDPPQAAQATGTLASHVLSNSGESVPPMLLMLTVSQRQSNIIHAVSNPSTSSAKFVDDDEVRSQGTFSNKQRTFPEVSSSSSNFLTSSRCSPDTVSASSSMIAKSDNILNLHTPNYPKVSVISAQTLLT